MNKNQILGTACLNFRLSTRSEQTSARSRFIWWRHFLAVPHFLVLFVFTLAAAPEAWGVTRYWTGDVNANWSNPGNWKPNGVPQNGDILAFSRGKNHSSVNDLVNLEVWALVFDLYSGDGGSILSPPDGDFTISGNPLHIHYQESFQWAPLEEGNVTYIFEVDSAIWAFGGGAAGLVGIHPIINCPLILDAFCPVTLNGFDGGSGGNKLHFNGNIDLNGHTLDLDSLVGKIELAGVISGTGDINSHPQGENDGSVEFQGSVDDTFNGTLRVDDYGTSLNKTGGSAARRVLVRSGGTLTWKKSNQLGEGAAVFSTGGQVLLAGFDETIGSLHLTNTPSATSNSVVDTGGGTLKVLNGTHADNNSASMTPVIRGLIEMPVGSRSFTINGSAYAGLDVQAEITGLGSLIKDGTAAMILSAHNSFASYVSIFEGILDVRHNDALSVAGLTVITGGNLTLRNVSILYDTLSVERGNGAAELPGGAITVIGAATWGGPITLKTNLTVVGGDMVLSGPISGPGGLGCFSLGTMTLTGTGTNTYTGKTLVRCPLLQLNKPYAVNAFAGPLEVGGGFGGDCEVLWLNSYQNPGATVTLFDNGLLNLNNFAEDLGPITFNGGNIQTGTGSLGLYGLVTANESDQLATISGNAGLPAGDREFRVLGDIFNSAGLAISAAINGPGKLIKTGGGMLQLGGASTYSGLTMVNEGVLSISSPTALGASGDASTFVADGATVQLNSIGATPVPERISIRGRGIGFGLGALDVIGQAQLRNQFSSIYACLDLTTNATVSIFGAVSKLQADGFVSGQGSLTKTGAGVLVYTNGNANTYSGTTIIQEGLLELRKPNNTIAVPGPLVLAPGTTARCYQSGGMPSTNSVTANGNSLLDLNGNIQSLSQLNLNDGPTVQTGAGTLQFAGGGAINIGTSNGPIQGLRQGASITGKMQLPSFDYLYCNVLNYGPAPLTSEPELAIPANISGTGNIIKNGGGALRLTGANTFDGTAQFYSGEVDVNGGTLIAGSATALGGTKGETHVSNGSSLALINTITIANESLFLDSTNNAALDNRGGNNIWNGPIQFSRNSGVNVAQDWLLICTGVLSGSGGFTKWGAGVMYTTGSANNSYGGDTSVNAGTLVLAKPNAVTAVPGFLVVGESSGGGAAAIARNLNSYQVFSGIIVNSQGLYDINGWEENTDYLGLNGNARVETGAGFLSLKVGASVAVAPGTNTTAIMNGHIHMDTGNHVFTVASGSTIPGTNDLLVNAQIDQISAAAGIEKAGAGKMRLTGTNTYTGITTVSGGTLQVDGLQPLSQVQLSGARLQGTGFVGPITFSGNTAERLAPGASPGILSCGNLNATSVGGGTLELELNGTVAGTNYDQVNVHGTVNLNGLKITGSVGFASTVGNQFTIINNDGSDPVVGTFSGLAQGGKVYVGSELFQINYTGGSGNDVVLSRLVTPPPPVLTIQRASTNSIRLLWPTNDPPFRLVSATNLAAPNWTQALPLPSVVGTNNLVTNIVIPTKIFYRLVNP